MLVVFQLLAAYRVAKCPYIGQIHTDTKAQRQTDYLDLIYSSKEYESGTYVPIFMSCCILPVDETLQGQLDSILSLME